MTDTDPQDLLDSLSSLLEEERNALLSGALEDVADILERKERLIDALAAQDLHDRPALEQLHASLSRNQQLYDRALEGIRSVSTRLSALRRVRKTLETYDSMGRKTDIAEPPAQRLERRA